MITVEPLQPADIAQIAAAFAAIRWNKTEQQFEAYIADGQRGLRVSLVARVDGMFAGYVTLLWAADYASFRHAEVPELQDLNVLPDFRRQGIATRLLERAEDLCRQRATQVGIAVGLTADYGPAQRLYARRGYIPDGRGAQSHGTALHWGATVSVDDSLVFYMTKSLGG